MNRGTLKHIMKKDFGVLLNEKEIKSLYGYAFSGPGRKPSDMDTINTLTERGFLQKSMGGHVATETGLMALLKSKAKAGDK